VEIYIICIILLELKKIQSEKFIEKVWWVWAALSNEVMPMVAWGIEEARQALRQFHFCKKR